MYNPNVTPYTPGNVDDTTRMLIGLKQKGQLQQYVQQHSSDPNLVALALYVNNLDSAVRGQQAQQQAQQMQQQPTVVEEQIAKMAPQQLPEDVGIGALPAPNIEGFANGGIVGYADGGGMGYNPASGPAGRLAYDNEPVLRMADGGIVALAGGELIDYGKYGFGNTGNQPRYTEEQLLEAKRLREMGIWDGLKETLGPLLEKFSQPFGAKPVRQETFQTGLDIGGPGSSPASWAPQAAGVGAGAGAGAGSGAGSGARPPAPPAPPAPPVAPAAKQQGIADIVRAAEEQFGTKEPEFNRAAALAEKEKYMGVHPAKAQMERLAKLDEMAAAEREDAKGFAILRAGLGMMASKSPMGLVGIGEGAQAGLTDYQAALKELKAAEMDRAKQRATAENAMYAAKEGNWDDVDKRYDNYMNRREKASEKMMSLYGTLTSTQMQGETQRYVADTSAAAHRAAAGAAQKAQLDLYEKLGKADPDSALRRGYEIAREQGAMPQMYANYQKLVADEINGDRFRKQFPTFADYLAGMGGSMGGGFDQLPKNATVRTAPGKP